MPPGLFRVVFNATSRPLCQNSRCLVRDLLEFECEGTFHIHDFGLLVSLASFGVLRRTHMAAWVAAAAGLVGTVADLMASMYVMKYERRKCIKHEIAEMK